MACILLIEDSRSIREALSEVLTALGHRVHVVRKPQEALAVLWGKEAIDLVISDLVMPEMNALELHDELRKLQQGVKLLVTTFYPMPGTGMTLAARPGVRWISRGSMRMHTLDRVIREMLGSTVGQMEAAPNC